MTGSGKGRKVVRGGEVIDGTGAGPVRADVLVEGDRIVEVGLVEVRPGDLVIDAAGAFVTPGFINIHGHSDLSVLTAPAATNRVFDGVTTEVSGQCGGALFPAVGAARGQIVAEAEREGVEVDWSDFAGYAERIERSGSAINHVFFAGHGTLRAAAMGLDDRPPTAEEMKRMRRLLEEALEQGAFGLSTGLIYPPGCFADEDELADLASLCAKADPPAIYASHQRNEGNTLEKSLAEFLAVLRRSGVRGQLSHVKVSRPENWHKIHWLKRELEEARREGLPLTGDRYPYTASSTGLGRDLPKWTWSGGREAFLARIADRDTRRRIAGEMAVPDPADYWSRIVVVWSAAPQHAPFIGRSVLDIARERGGEPFEVVCDLLLEADARVDAVYHRMSEENLVEVLSWPFIAVGSDSRLRPADEGPRGGLPHPRAFGTHCRVLGRYVREKGILTWAEAVYKMTGLPADILGLTDRGSLLPGASADIVVFDPRTVADRATYEEPRQLSVGVRHVLVNGEVVLEDGRETGARPGRVIRRR